MNSFKLQEINESVKRWASRKGAFITLESYAHEIATWSKIAGVSRVRRVLEIGSGSGWFLVTAVALGFAVEATGVDPAIPEAGTNVEEISDTEEIIQRLGLSDRVRLCRGTFQDILAEREHEKYDLLVFRNTLHHIYPRLNTGGQDQHAKQCIDDLRSARRLLKPSGYIYVMEASRNLVIGALYNVLRTLRGARPIAWTTKRTAQEWQWILEKAGFEILGLRRLPLHPICGIPGVTVLSKVLSLSFVLAGRSR